MIELMVVMAILVLATALIPLALNRMLPKQQMAKAVRSIELYMLEAQTQSLMQRKTVHISIHGQVISLDSIQRAKATGVLIVPAELKLSVTDLSGQALRGINLYPDGAAEGTKFEITQGARKTALVMSPLTGRITVQTGI